LASEWREYSIGDIADVVGGSTPSTKIAANFDGDIPWLTPKDLAGGHNRWIERGERSVSQQGLDTSSARLVPAGSVLLSTRAPIGYVAIAANPIATNQGFRSLLLKEGFDPEFMYYWLVANTEELERHANGSTFKELSGGSLREIRVSAPSLEEQRAIAHILGSLDDKIELNRRMNETLEAIARALFKSWFVDFDPVRAKSEGRDPGLPPHLADLFPDSFEDSELGEIPSGWRVSGLDEIATYLNGLALQKYPPDDSGSLPVIKIAQLRAGHTDGADRASAEIPPAYVVEDGDILFSWSGSLEVEIWCGGRGALNQHLFKVTSDRYPKWFYFLWTRHHLADFRGIAAAKATTMGHIQRGHVSAATALVPPAQLVDAMSAYFEPLLHNLIATRLQSRTLAALRDSVLPKLISGALRADHVMTVPDRATA
jgi:type I restriction enzyme, S subunit